MRFLLQFHPRNFFRALREIDDEAAAERASLTGPDYRPAIILLVAAFCLLICHYATYSHLFRKFLLLLSQYMGHTSPRSFYRELASTSFFPLMIHVWWVFWLFIGYVFIPVLVIKWVLWDSIRSYGLGISRLSPDLKWYLYLLAAELVAIMLVSFRKDFIRYYPFYRMAHRSWADLLAWEIIYLSQIVFGEFFFRGFLLHGCRRAFGSNAIFVMCVPYLMIHFGKPWIEAVGSMFIGLFLGLLVLRSRSIWGAVLLHCAMALSMDLMSLLQARGLPAQWWP